MNTLFMESDQEITGDKERDWDNMNYRMWAGFFFSEQIEEKVKRLMKML